MIAILVASILVAAGEPGPLTLESLPVQAAALAALPRAELKVEADGKTSSYTGVALASILGARRQPVEGMPGLRELSDAVLLVRGADGYQAAVSAAAVAMDAKGERYFLATGRDGQPRAPQLIIPGDAKRARWVRDVVAVRLVRLDRVVKSDP